MAFRQAELPTGFMVGELLRPACIVSQPEPPPEQPSAKEPSGLLMNTTRRLFLAGASLIAVNLAGEGGLRPGRRRGARRGLARRDRRHPEVRPPRQLERRFRRAGEPGREGRLQAADLLAADRHLHRAGDRPVSADRRAGRLADGAGHQEAQARRHRSRRRGAAQAADGFGRPVAARRHLAILRHLCRRRGEALPGPSRPAGRRRHGQVHLCRA